MACIIHLPLTILRISGSHVYIGRADVSVARRAMAIVDEDTRKAKPREKRNGAQARPPGEQTDRSDGRGPFAATKGKRCNQCLFLAPRPRLIFSQCCKGRRGGTDG